MAYNKQDFRDGNVVFAEQLERIEDAIIDIEKQILDILNTLHTHIGMELPVDNESIE